MTSAEYQLWLYRQLQARHTYGRLYEETTRLRAENDRLRAELARAGVETRP